MVRYHHQSSIVRRAKVSAAMAVSVSHTQEHVMVIYIVLRAKVSAAMAVSVRFILMLIDATTTAMTIMM
jgi:hypothetical protein